MQPTVEITQQMSAMSISKKKRPSPYSKRPRRVPEIVIQRPSRNPTPMPSPKPIRKANSMPSSLDFDRMLSEIKHVDSQQKLQQTINEHWIQGGGKQLANQPNVGVKEGLSLPAQSRPWLLKRRPLRSVVLSIKIMGGESFEIETDQLATIESVKQQIATQKDIPINEIRLLAKGKAMTTVVCDYDTKATIMLSRKKTEKQEETQQKQQRDVQMQDVERIKDKHAFWEKISQAIQEHVDPSEQGVLLMKFKNAVE
ncbi:hypothetical protein EDD86DRAFT_218410 [Gorgonomyces haynaldii]|nr:hypothetical protein EDD86DRAFT_218410 [Gorgonomyces haynaldii]